MDPTAIQTQETAWLAVIIRDIAKFWHLILPGIAALVVAFIQNRQSRHNNEDILQLRDRVSKLEQKIIDLHPETIPSGDP